MTPKPVTAYRCTTCKEVHAVQADAEKCCRCKCGAPTESLSLGLRAARCSRCRTKEWKRNAQDTVRRLRRQLADAEKSLAELSK